ncbi:MAG TPA: type I 3-dehydroquinate dehydratase [Gemmataceae bacterium]|nr:type I 3-dehydroquinate dehydratase [Gemmataceae bacterium]
MICISIAQASRRMALVDMLNASKQCDLVEVRLDCFEKTPDVAELLEHKPKPIIMSCRRLKDGGQFSGSEEERLTLLRQCIVGKADYVEIELDVADQIRRFPPAKRVITYTNLQEAPRDIAEIYGECQSKSPDVIKLVINARTPEDAWPLLQIVARQTIPTVVVGIGKPGIMLSVLGKKIGAPWTYAALEKGMEAYPGQPSVRELRDIFHYDKIEKSTRFLGVTGFGEQETAKVAAFNALLAQQKSPVRCLPLGLGSLPIFRKVMDAVKLAGVVVDAEHQEAVVSLASTLTPEAATARAVDLLLPGEQGWVGHNTTSKAIMGALESALAEKSPSEKPLQGRLLMIVGVNAVARAVGHAAREREARIIVASHHKQAAQQLAQALECRFVQWEALYSTMHDAIVVCDDERDQMKSKTATGEAGLHPGYLKAGMVVMDLTAPRPTAFLRGAKSRGCGVVYSHQLWPEQIALQANLLTGQQPDMNLVRTSLAPFFEED